MKSIGRWLDGGLGSGLGVWARWRLAGWMGRLGGGMGGWLGVGWVLADWLSGWLAG